MTAASIEDKKTFLLESSRLYEAMIRLTTSEVLRRYLAFRIIVNAMAFEDLIGNRLHARMRQIRNVLLAHKQEADFFAGYRAAEDITNATISPLMSLMTGSTSAPDPSYAIPELLAGESHKAFSYLMPLVFEKFHEDFLSGHRLINNHLCYTGSSIQEVGSGPLPGVFYRYHSSMALFQLAQYIHNNALQAPLLTWTVRHSKLDMLLHAQNLADTVFKDSNNSHSIEGLWEVMSAEAIGNVVSLQTVKNDPNFARRYTSIRRMRNKLIGHMDKQAPLPTLVAELDALSVQDSMDLVNAIDKAVFDAAKTHPAIRVRYLSGNQPINNPAIVDIPGLKPTPYF
jgi:hypothetical protein